MGSENLDATKPGMAKTMPGSLFGYWHYLLGSSAFNRPHFVRI
jgi:hypothetical protein